MQTPGWGPLFITLAILAGCGRGAAPVTAPPPAPPPAARVDHLAAAALLADVRWLADPARAGRGSRTDDAGATAAWLEQQLGRAGYTVTRVPIPDLPAQVDVVATYPGTAPRAPALLIVAHYDHLGIVAGAIHPGADDNASGVAVALGVARALVAERRVARPITFVFTGGEELGLFGSRAYAAAPLRPLAETRAVVNLDMVGRRFFEQVVDRDAAIGAVGLGDDAALAAAAERAARRAGLAIVRVSPALLTAIGQGLSGDDWSFRRPGLPAVHFSTGLHDDYHAPTDTVAHIDPAQLARTAALVHALVEELDGEVTRPAARPGRASP